MSLQHIARERGLRYFLVSFSDLFGVARAKLIPAGAIDSVLGPGAPFAGFATWLDLTPADPDIYAVPDVHSLLPLPWKPEVGWLAADVHQLGKPLAQAPRNVLKAVLATAASRGYEMRTGVECEFFLLDPDATGPSDLKDSQPKPCYDQLALMRRYDLISRICDAIEALGWEPYQNDHEDANGQFEINWKYADALTTADRQTFFKLLVRTMAEEAGLRATFMPKPFSKLTGNGCHTHVSVWDRERNCNLFDDVHDSLGLSQLAYQFLGGVLHSADALCAVMNPTVNSYRRIHAPVTTSGATWSPNTVSYAGNNRTHMIRIPDPGRFEVRVVDGAANPYLLAAALLAAGLDGVDQQRDPGPPLESNVYDSADGTGELRQLPRDLNEALRAFAANTPLQKALGSPFCSAFLKLKHAEWRDYSRHVSQWERDHTLDC